MPWLSEASSPVGLAWGLESEDLVPAAPSPQLPVGSWKNHSNSSLSYGFSGVNCMLDGCHTLFKESSSMILGIAMVKLWKFTLSRKKTKQRRPHVSLSPLVMAGWPRATHNLHALLKQARFSEAIRNLCWKKEKRACRECGMNNKPWLNLVRLRDCVLRQYVI